MKKLTFNYDEESDQLIDANGVCILSCFKSMNYYSVEEVGSGSKLKVRDVADLKSEGFNADDIIEMHKAGVI